MPDTWNGAAFEAIPPAPPAVIPFVGSVLIRDYFHSGWCRRSDGECLVPIQGWRLVLHRILWGYSGLVYIKPAPRITVFDSKWAPIGELVADA
jgi:hypothetical protein